MNGITRKIPWIALFTLFAVACGSSDDDNTNANSAKTGTVRVTNTLLSSGRGYRAEAFFQDRTGVDPGQPCDVSTLDGCTVRDCPPNTSGKSQRSNAGAVHVSGGSLPAELQMAPSSDSKYASVTGTASVWSGGEDITIRADGTSSGVGAFSGTLKAPSRVVLSKPEWASSESGPTISKAQGLDVAWSLEGSASGTMNVLFTATKGSGSGTDTRFMAITCGYPVGDLHATVPSSVLNKLPSAHVNFGVSVTEERELPISDWNVSLVLVADATRDGALAAGEISFR